MTDQKHLLETLEFARDQLRAAGGKDNAAGIREEAARRIDAIIEGDSFKNIREQARAETLAAKLMALIPHDVASRVDNVHPHCAYSDSVVRFNAETEEEAIAMLERMPLAPEIINTVRYKGSFMTGATLDAREAKKPGKYQDAHDSAPWWASVSTYQVEIHSYVEVDDGTVRVDFRIEKPSLRATARRVEFSGGFRFEDPRVEDPHGLFTKRVRMWSSPEYIPNWILY